MGSEDLARALKSAIVREGLDARVCTSGCFDLCGAGPAVAIMPDGVFLRQMTAADVHLVLQCLRSSPDSWASQVLAKLARAQDWETGASLE
jgi:(2Fe-2S) ferredoxin